MSKFSKKELEKVIELCFDVYEKLDWIDLDLKGLRFEIDEIPTKLYMKSKENDLNE